MIHTMSKFNERFTQLRNESNLSLRQLSDLTGISPSALHSYEKGKREASYKSLAALANVFSCDIEYLLGRIDERKLSAKEHAQQKLDFAAQENSQRA